MIVLLLLLAAMPLAAQEVFSSGDAAANAPYYGLATAQGMTSGELSLLRLKGYKVDDPTKGYLRRTGDGKVMYSDIDIHGIDDKAGNDVWPKSPEGEKALIDRLNGSTLERMFQHGPQDAYPRRNDPTSPSFGPQPPVTIYTADGRTLFIDSIPKIGSRRSRDGRGLERDLPATQLRKVSAGSRPRTVIG